MASDQKNVKAAQVAQGASGSDNSALQNRIDAVAREMQFLSQQKSGDLVSPSRQAAGQVPLAQIASHNAEPANLFHNQSPPNMLFFLSYGAGGKGVPGRPPSAALPTGALRPF